MNQKLLGSKELSKLSLDSDQEMMNFPLRKANTKKDSIDRDGPTDSLHSDE